MAQKIKLSDLKVQSFVTVLDKKERKATKGGYYFPRGGGKKKFGSSQWLADTLVDIRDGFISTDEPGIPFSLNDGD